jgi:hypothetical protein
MRLTAAHKALLLALIEGQTLKVHREVDGAKYYRLHPLDGSPPSAVGGRLVQDLLDKRLLESNMKFPAAVFLLTAQGAQIATTLRPTSTRPIGPRLFES